MVQTAGTPCLYAVPLYQHYFGAIRPCACSPFARPPRALLHQPPSRNSQIFPKRGGSRRAIFAACARDTTRLILPSPRPALRPLQKRAPGAVWRRAGCHSGCRCGGRESLLRRKRGELPVCSHSSPCLTNSYHRSARLLILNRPLSIP